MTKTEKLDRQIAFLERRLKNAVSAKIKHEKRKIPQKSIIGIDGAARRRIYDYLLNSPGTAKDISMDLNLNYHVVQQRLRELQKLEVLVAVGKRASKTHKPSTIWGAKPDVLP